MNEVNKTEMSASEAHKILAARLLESMSVATKILDEAIKSDAKPGISPVVHM